MDNDEKPASPFPSVLVDPRPILDAFEGKTMRVKVQDGGVHLSDKLTPSECNAMLDAWRAAFPEAYQGALFAEPIARQAAIRYAEKGSALDRASRLWGCAWLVKGKGRKPR